MKRTVMVVLSVVTALSAMAEERRDLDAHEHGHSVLNIAIEGDRVSMELISPGLDIVGFEHPAESRKHKAAIEQARAVLANPLALFVLPADAGCVLETAVIEIEEESDHEEHAHDESHDADEEEHAEGEDEASHTEFHVEYAITCESPDHLGGITFAFFEQFPDAEEIEVTVITENGQTRYEVDRDAPRLDLKGLI